jgi:hypothetical protein
VRRKLLENEILIRKWGQLNLSSHRLWIESGDEDNYFLNSLQLNEIQGHSIIKYVNQSLLNYAIICFILIPVSIILLKYSASLLGFSAQALKLALISSGISFFLLALNFLWNYSASRRLSLNFQTGSKNLYFKLTGDFAKIEDALEFSNLVDAQIHHLQIQLAEGPVRIESKEPRSFKIS